MGILSYAQNFEDVILWRALQHVDRGYYIDVGAQHPVVDSVSKAFYERGWRGISVEPNAFYADLIRKDRPDETVVQAVIAERSGVVTFYEIPETGLSTAAAEVAQTHRANGLVVNETAVTAVTLDDLLGMAGSRSIHWMKIDVEGFEAEVLAGWKKAKQRPAIVVIESTYPNSQRETHDAWESLVLAKGYTLAFVDGLNRYYLSDLQPELRQSLRYGANVFDGFTLAESSWATGSVRQIYEAKIDGASADAARLRQQITELLAVQKQLEADAELKAKSASTLIEQSTAKAKRAAHTQLQEVTGLKQVFEERLARAGEKLAELRQAHALHEQLLLSQRTRASELAGHLEDSQRATTTQLQLSNTREQGLARDLEQTRVAAAEQLRLLGEREQMLLAHLEEFRRTTAQQLQLGEQREQVLARHLKEAQALAAEQRRLRDEREQTLGEQLTDVQHAHAGQLQLRDERERELARQLNEAQRATAHQLHMGNERERELARQLSEAQRGTAQQLHMRDEREQALHHELSAIRAQMFDVQESAAQALTSERQDRHALELIYAELRSQFEAAEKLIADNRTQLKMRAQELAAITRAIDEMRSTWSWRWSRPLRQIFRRLTNQVPANDVPVVLIDNLANHVGEIESKFEHQIGNYMPSEGVAMTLDELMQLPAERFLRATYKCVLGREPDNQGLGYYMKRLAQGHGRASVVHDLARSEEALRYEKAQDLDHLSDLQFLEQVFIRFIGRTPDPAGCQHYLKLLKQGKTRLSIARDVCGSEEARNSNTPRRQRLQLGELAMQYQKNRGWLGWFRRSERLGRRIEQINFQIGQQFVGMDSVLQQLQHQIDHVSRASRSTEEKVAPVAALPRSGINAPGVPFGNVSIIRDGARPIQGTDSRTPLEATYQTYLSLP